MAQISVTVKIPKVPTMQISRMIQSVKVHAEGEPGFGPAKVDIAWAGMFFVIAEAAQFGLDLSPAYAATITQPSECLCAAAELSGQAWIYGTANWTLDPGDPFHQGYQITDSNA